MSYSFIIGSSGSGKTYHVYKKIIEEALKNPTKPFFLIVPEQYTMQTQKDLLQIHPDHALFHIDVLSFNRLAHRVFAELGIHIPDILDDTGKALILRKVASKLDLHVWKNGFSKVGFLEQVKSMISELYQYEVKTNDLDTLLKNKEIDALLRMKLADLKQLHAGFYAYISGNYITTEGILDILAKTIGESSLCKDGVFYFDGFTGFTPIQYRVIEEIMKLACDIHICVTLGEEQRPYRQVASSHLFYLSHTLINTITDIASRNQIPKAEDILLNEVYEGEIRPRFKSASLDFLERNFLRNKKSICLTSDDGIRVIHVKNPDAEARMVSNQILYLVKKEGYRYRDIAVITGDIEGRADKLSRLFYLNEIPCHIDRNIRIEDNALVEMIRASLSLVIENYSYDALGRFMRLGLLDLDKDMVNLLDNYILATGIKGRERIQKDFTYLPKNFADVDLLALNIFKNSILEKIEPLYEIFSKEPIKAHTLASALRAILESENIDYKLARYSEKFAYTGDGQRAREYEKVYSEICTLLDKMEKLLGEDPLTKRDCLDLLEAGLAQISVGIIPAGVDRVIVGDLTRTRLDHVKALFVIGVNDGILPKIKESGGLINDREKQNLKKQGLSLSSTVKEDIFIQRFYLYQMFTKPSEKLIISYTGMDGEGKSLRPSSMIANIRSLFMDLEVEMQSTSSSLYSQYEAKEYIIDALRRFYKGQNEKFPDMFAKIFHQFDIRKYMQAAAYVYTGEGIGKEAARNLFGKELRGSVTRLEKFIGCPYAHFAGYGLELKEREVYSFEASDIGSFMHEMLENIFRGLQKRHVDFSSLDTIQISHLVEDISKEVILFDEKGIYQHNAKSSYQLGRLLEMTKQTVWVLVEQLKKGDFTPYAFEKSFGEQDKLSSLSIPLGKEESLLLRGKIDRIDICETNENVLVKIIDYKSGKTSWETDLCYYGTQMQLVVYLDAVMEILKQEKKKDILPAALLYYNIAMPMFSRDAMRYGKDAQILRALKPNGIVNTDIEIIKHLDTTIESESDVIPVVLKDGIITESRSRVASTKRITRLREYVREKMKMIATNIVDGEVRAYPSRRGDFTNCSYCPYLCVCGFDKHIDGFDYHRLEKMKTSEVWEKIDEESKEADGMD